jgi:AcrR family transcriptional regulator
MGMGEKKDRTAKSQAGLNPEVYGRLEAAVLDIFSEQDFHRASMREVAKKAGVSFSSIYNYFGSKEKLLFACVDNWLKVLIERMVDHLQGIEDLKEKLRKVFWLQLDYYEKNPRVGKVLFLTVPYQKWLSDKTFKQAKMTSLFLDVIREGMENGRIHPDIRPEVALDLFLGLVQRRFTMWVYRGERESLTKDTNELFEMLWRAVSNPGA